MIEELDEETDYRRFSARELIVLATRGDDQAISELERREDLKRAAAEE